MVKEVLEQSRREHLKKLFKYFERDQTIQDVGAWLTNDSLDPLPPKHVAVLREWLETHNELTINQYRTGPPHSDVRNAFLYITRLNRDTGMSVEAACILVAEELNLQTDPANLRRSYDRARTPETRFINDLVKATGAFSKTDTPRSDIEKAGKRMKKAKAVRKAKHEQKAKAAEHTKATRIAKAAQKKKRKIDKNRRNNRNCVDYVSTPDAPFLGGRFRNQLEQTDEYPDSRFNPPAIAQRGRHINPPGGPPPLPPHSCPDPRPMGRRRPGTTLHQTRAAARRIPRR